MLDSLHMKYCSLRVSSFKELRIKVIFRDNIWTQISLVIDWNFIKNFVLEFILHPVKFDYGKMIRKKSVVERRGLDIREKTRKIYIIGGL